MNLRPHYIRVTHADQEATLVHYRLGQGQRRVLVIAGVHGREHGGIQAAYELLERLARVRLRGQVDVLPVCNPLAYAAETRFTPGSDRDMARAFTPGKPNDLIEALSQAVTSLAEKAEVVLNLHSAGDARYLPHVLFYRDQDVEWAASLGFPFAIKQGMPEKLVHHLASRLRPEQRTATLELGGGTVAFPEDVALGVELVMAFLGRSGFLGPGDYEREATPPGMIWLTDTRLFMRAPGEGAFYTHARPGADFVRGESFGFWVGLDDLRPRLLSAPTTGKLIYLRTRNRVPHGGTLAMFLPPHPATVGLEVEYGQFLLTIPPGEPAPVAEAAPPAAAVARDGQVGRGDEGGVGGQTEGLLRQVNLGQPIPHISQAQTCPAVVQAGGEDVLCSSLEQRLPVHRCPPRLRVPQNRVATQACWVWTP